MTPRPSSRTAIMDAALSCFAQNGYDATRIRDIAQEAGVSRERCTVTSRRRRTWRASCTSRRFFTVGEELIRSRTGR